MNTMMGKLRGGEEVIPDRPELRGTVAERLAAMRTDAAFALWAVRFGPGAGSRRVLREWDPGQGEEALYTETTVAGAAERMWGACRRPDWMVDALALSKAFGAGNETHRRVVAFLVAGVRKRAGAAVRGKGERLLKLVDGWTRIGPASVLTVPVSEIMASAEAVNVEVAAAMRTLSQAKAERWDEARERAAYLTFGAVAGAYFSGLAVFDPRGVATVAMILALLSTDGADIVSDEVAAEVRAAFSVPEELRS